jgi:hypothetical protein
MGSFVNNIPGLLSQLTGSVTSAVTQAGLVTVEDMFKKRTAEDIEKRTISIQQIGALIQDIEQVSFLYISVKSAHYWLDYRRSLVQNRHCHSRPISNYLCYAR